MKLIGRVKEQLKFKDLLNTNQSEFIAVYGRRRVGKTFLIRETFQHNLDFKVTGLANAKTALQLANFNYALIEFGKTNNTIPKNWIEAFHELKILLNRSSAKKKILFIDEMPWMDTPRSNFISALEHFWNGWAAAQKDILLIVCGSATSWMINKLINNKGGLHNRVTYKMKIEPFTLKECETFLKHKKIDWNRYQIIGVYMVTGGIPFYLNALQKELSANQNINQICFSPNGLLKTEFNNLYASLFRKSENHIAIVRSLSKKSKGLTRDEVIKGAKLANGGTMTKILQELEECGFIKRYTPYEKKQKLSLYQLIDFYTLFYFRFIENKNISDNNYWLNMIDHPIYRAWSGYAFEQVCMAHIPQLKMALGISGVQTSVYSWKSLEKKGGAQIDLVIDRRDQVISIFEMKYSLNTFTIDAKYAENLRNKIGVFKTETKTKKAVYLSMLTTYGLKNNAHSDLVQNNLTMDCLFWEERS